RVDGNQDLFGAGQRHASLPTRGRTGRACTGKHQRSARASHRASAGTEYRYRIARRGILNLVARFDVLSAPPLVHHECAFEFHYDLAVLIESSRLDGHDPEIRTGLRFALLEDFAPGVDGVSLENGVWHDDF